MTRNFFHFFLFLVGSLYAQHQDKVDFTEAQVLVEPLPDAKSVKGTVTYQFTVLASVDSVFLDAHQMQFHQVLLNDKKIKFRATEEKLVVPHKFKKGHTYQLTTTYSAQPKQTLYFMGWDDDIKDNEQIWTQGQGKYTRHWLPSFDEMQEKVVFDLNILAPKGYQVIANGKLLTQKDSLHKSLWKFDMQNPMSSYLLAFAVGKYKKQKLTSNKGVAIENFYLPKDSARVEPTYRYTREIFNFLEEEIGVDYPWQNYKQIPVRDFLYAGMENTGTTIFSDGYVIDSTAFVDKNYVKVNAHELAHQWFGNLVTEQDGNHHWLHEGFATFYAYLAEREIFGDDYLYWKLWETAQELQRISDNDQGQALTDPRASSLTFYEKGAWALVILKERVGEEEFKKGVANYLEKYAFKNVTVDDFLKELENAGQMDLSDFKNSWLNNTAFLGEEARTLLIEKCPSIRLFYSEEIKRENLDSIFEGEHPHQLKIALLEKFKSKLSSEELLKLTKTTDVLTRQKAIQLLEDVPPNMESAFASYLADDSYITRELVLYKLWSQFPESRKKYLEATKDIAGLPNKNVRLLWLTLAIVTPDFEPENTPKFIAELEDLTSQAHTWETRLGAFQYFSEIGFTEKSLEHLIMATEHHSWQFKKYARNLIEQLLKEDALEKRISGIFEKLNSGELRYMKSKLDTK